ncbi:MAG: metal ABC transporter permease [Candidatus Porifericomitaceae bacterium WSBS_2022_MAG_OTU9]
MVIPVFDEPFIVRAMAAGVGVALIAGPTGCFVVWRRMAYFGDSLAHSALLGIVLGLATGISANLGTIIVCSTFALLLTVLQHNKVLATDTLLGILAHSALATGMIAISLLEQNINIHSYLFGDILTVTTQELWWIYIGGAVVLAMLLLNWQSLVLMTIHEDTAMAEGVRIMAVNLMLMFMMAIMVAISIRIVGILFISAMLIIPAATARQLTRSPKTMAIAAAVLGIVAVLIGINGSLHLDMPSGPAIVATASILFAISLPAAAIIAKVRPAHQGV